MNTLEHLFGPQSAADQIETNTFVLMSRFLQLIEQVMDDRSMTRRELAMKIGTSASYVTQLFRGHKTANLETLAKIELALGITFEVQVSGVATVAENIDQESQAKGVKPVKRKKGK
jgi:transcriptional regulator with XRE-family HTH domain